MTTTREPFGRFSRVAESGAASGTTMIAPLAPRILALPADVRRALAGVDGPGWMVWDDEAAPAVLRRHPGPGMAGCWLPANPAASVGAVTGIPIWRAHYALFVAMDGTTDDDYAAALSIIEAHVAGRSTDG